MRGTPYYYYFVQANETSTWKILFSRKSITLPSRPRKNVRDIETWQCIEPKENAPFCKLSLRTALYVYERYGTEEKHE